MTRLKTTLNAALLSCGLAFVAAPALADNHQRGGALTEDQIEARYDQAKERCDAMDGDRKSVCEQEARTERDKAKADAEAREATAEARQDAAEDKRDADRKLAEERCDAMSGAAQDSCEADVKAKYDR